MLLMAVPIILIVAGSVAFSFTALTMAERMLITTPPLYDGQALAGITLAAAASSFILSGDNRTSTIVLI